MKTNTQLQAGNAQTIKRTDVDFSNTLTRAHTRVHIHKRARIHIHKLRAHRHTHTRTNTYILTHPHKTIHLNTKT